MMNHPLLSSLSIILVLAFQPLTSAGSADNQQPEPGVYIERSTPDGMKAPPHFSYVVTAKATKTIYISGMTASDRDGDYETQLRQCYEKIGKALKSAGATPAHIVRQRLHIVDINPDYAPITRKVMQEFYRGPGPASTAVGTPGLFFPGLLVEVDVTAVINE